MVQGFRATGYQGFGSWMWLSGPVFLENTHVRFGFLLGDGGTSGLQGDRTVSVNRFTRIWTSITTVHTLGTPQKGSSKTLHPKPYIKRELL